MRWTVLEILIVTLLGFLATVALARLLDPEDRT